MIPGLIYNGIFLPVSVRVKSIRYMLNLKLNIDLKYWTQRDP